MKIFGNKIILFVLAGLLAVAAGAGVRIYSALHADSDDVYEELQKQLGEDSAEYEQLKKQGSFNMLIMGEDNVEGSSRSDTILFVRVDIAGKNLRILSLPRDTRVEIPGHGTQKLNHAFAFGKQDLMKATVERLLGKPILYYVIVDYDSFPALVDLIGGVEIDVKKKMRYVDRAGHLDININPGVQVLDGKTALHFVRFRKDALGDIGRVQRQQQFVKALLKKAYDPAALVKIPEITSQMMKIFKTDMKPSLAIALAGFVQGELGRDRIFFSTLHGEAAMINRLSYWIGDVKAANAFLDAPISALISGDISDNAKDSHYAGLSLTYSSALDEDNGGRNDAKSDDKAGSADKRSAKKEAEMTRDELLALVRSIPESVAVLNGTGRGGVADQVASRLQKIGIDVIHTGNAKHFDYQTSNVVYPPQADARVIDTANKLGSLLGVPKVLIRKNKQAFYASIIIGHDSAELIKRLDKMLALSAVK